MLGGPCGILDFLGGPRCWGDLHLESIWGDLNVWGDLISMGGPRTPVGTHGTHFNRPCAQLWTYDYLKPFLYGHTTIWMLYVQKNIGKFDLTN